MKNLTNRVIPFSFIYTLFLFCCTTLHAGNFTWTGNTSTDWGTPSNWSPSGVPSTNDTITVVTGSNQVHLKTNESVKMITVTSGTVDLKTYSISISATANFNGGTVNNGSVLINSTATTTFKGTSFGAFVQAKSNSILLNGSRFDNGLTVIKKGTSADNSKGGNIYSGKVTIIDSSSGNMVLCDSFPDIYNDEVDIYNASTGTIYLAHRASGTVFHEKVTLNGSGIYSNYYGTATYYRLITINSPNGNIYFGYSTGSCTLGSESTLSMTESSMTSGWLYLRNFYQSDYSQTISIVLAGTARLYLESGSRFNGNFSANAPQVFLNGSKFYGTVNITNGGAANVSSSGGCYFDKEATITNYCSSPITFAMGTSAIDTFMNKVTLKNHVGTFSVNNCIAYGDVKLWNTNTTTSSDRFFIGSSGECRFKDSLVIDNSTSGMCFGTSGGTTTLDSVATLSMVSGFTGNITFKGFHKLGTGTQSFSFPSSSSKLILGPNNVWNGNFNFLGQYVQLNGNIFHGRTEITRYGTSNEISNGGNTFNDDVVLRDSVSAHSHNWYHSYVTSDTYNADATFVQKGTSVFIYPAYAANAIFKANVLVDGSSAIQFGASTGKVIFSGDSLQEFTKVGSYTPLMKKLQVNKTFNALKLNFPLSISDSLFLTNGVITTDTTNLLILANGSKLTGGSDSSYINGPMKKTGNTSFVFPLGSSSLAHPYHPLEITAPSSSTDAYTAMYFPTAQTMGTGIDTSIDNLNGCQYWKLNRNAGTSKVKVKIGWNHDSCETISPTNFRVTGWNGTIWKDLGNLSTFGDSIKGTVQSVDSLDTISTLTLAFRKCAAFRKTVDVFNVRCKGGDDASIQVEAKGGTSNYNFAWSNGLGESSSALNLRTGNYHLTISDFRGCVLSDTIEIREPDSIYINYQTIASTCNDSVGLIALNPYGGTGGFRYYWPYNNSVNDTLNNIPAGKYSVLIVDSNGCNLTKDFEIHDSDGPAVVITDQINVNCMGDATGRIEVEGINGNAPYFYKWNDNIDDSLNYLDNLYVGSYTVQVIDANGCIGLDTIEISSAETLTVSITQTNTPCGSSIGEIIATPQGGFYPFTYFWNGLSDTDSIVANLGAGDYTVEITDSLGCKINRFISLISSSGISLSAEVTKTISCYPDSLGEISATVSGGTGPYTYTWFPSGGSDNVSIPIPADHYFITVTDANGCIATTEIDLPAPPILKAFLNVVDPSADTLSDGSIETIVSGGVPPYSYDWSNYETTADISSLKSGIYFVTITDDNGCEILRQGNPHFDLFNNCFTCSDFDSYSLCTPSITLGSATKFIKANFGAVGDGYADDQCAFEEASAYFKALQVAQGSIPKYLYIEAGTYMVGSQVHTPDWFRKGRSVFCMEGIENLHVIGIGHLKPVLKFNPCMKFGTFDAPDYPEKRLVSDYSTTELIVHVSGNVLANKLIYVSGDLGNVSVGSIVTDPNIRNHYHYFFPSGTTTVTSIVGNEITLSNYFTVTEDADIPMLFHSDCYVNAVEYSKVAEVGTMFQMSNCINNSIENLELDGNIDNEVIGGGYMDGIQAAYDGIFLNASHEITLSNLYIHHFGHDGIYIIYKKCLGQPDPPVGYVTCNISNCKVEYNSRTNLAWGGGRHVNVFNSEFNFAALNRVASSTFSGVDIEYENSDLDNSSGTFTDCKFLFNKFAGVICDANGESQSTNYAYDYTFLRCSFVAGENGFTVWPNTRHMYFTTSRFYGQVVNPYNSIVSDMPGQINNTEFVQFNYCHFSDEFFDPINRQTRYFAPNQPDETVESFGGIVPVSPCPYALNDEHRYLLDFSHANRVRILNSEVRTNFGMKLILMQAPPNQTSSWNYNYLRNTTFYNSSINECACDKVLYSITHTIAGPDNIPTPSWIFNHRNIGHNAPTPPTCFPAITSYFANNIRAPFNDPVTGLTAGSLSINSTNALPFDPLRLRYHDPVDPNLVELSHTPCIVTLPSFPIECISSVRLRNPLTKNETNEILQISPNPASSIIEIKTGNIGEELKIIDIFGKVVFIKMMDSDKITIDISSFSSGFYFISPSQSKPTSFIKS